MRSVAVDDIRRRLGKRIREAREGLDLTQEQLADRLATKKSEISRWERGTSSPSIKRLPAVAAALGVEVHALFATDDTATSHRPEVAALARYLRGRSPEEVKAIDAIVRAIFALRGGRVR